MSMAQQHPLSNPPSNMSSMSSLPSHVDPSLSGGIGSLPPPAPSDQEILLAPYSTLDEPVMETVMRDVHAVLAKLKVVLLPLDVQKGGVGGGWLRGAGTRSLGKYSNLFGIASSPSADEEDPSPAAGGTPGPAVDEDATNTNTPASPTSTLPNRQNQEEIMRQLRDWDLWGPLLVCLMLSILLSTKAPNPSEASSVFAAVFVAVWVGSSIVSINARLLGAELSFFQSVCVLGYCIFPLNLAALIIVILRPTILGNVYVDVVLVSVAFVWSTRASKVFIGEFVKEERRFLAVFPVLFFYTFLGWMILLL